MIDFASIYLLLEGNNKVNSISVVLVGFLFSKNAEDSRNQKTQHILEKRRIDWCLLHSNLQFPISYFSPQISITKKYHSFTGVMSFLFFRQFLPIYKYSLNLDTDNPIIFEFPPILSSIHKKISTLKIELFFRKNFFEYLHIVVFSGLQTQTKTQQKTVRKSSLYTLSSS